MTLSTASPGPQTGGLCLCSVRPTASVTSKFDLDHCRVLPQSAAAVKATVVRILCSSVSGGKARASIDLFWSTQSSPCDVPDHVWCDWISPAGLGRVTPCHHRPNSPLGRFVVVCLATENSVCRDLAPPTLVTVHSLSPSRDSEVTLPLRLIFGECSFIHSANFPAQKLVWPSTAPSKSCYRIVRLRYNSI